jgi:GT2 family glycosyltransferase
MIRVDIVTVFHNETNHKQHLELFDAVKRAEPLGGYTLIGVDNRRVNRGFSAACNLGAFHEGAKAPVIAFLNPDVTVEGPFLQRALDAVSPDTVIAGCRYGKTDRELRLWGVRDWVCGAAMFVHRKWFTAVKGFDTRFVWSWEETDLIRQAESQGLTCRSISLPLQHSEPTYNSDEDAAYKRRHFTESERRYRVKWRDRR